MAITDHRPEQPDMFSDRLVTAVREEGTIVPIHHPTQSESYRIEHAYYDKHFPSVNQHQRDAGRLTASAATQDQAQIQFRQMEQDRGQDIER